MPLGTPEAFAGYCKCGNVVYLTANEMDHPKDTAKSVAQIIRNGLRLEGMTVEEVRKAPWGCTCPKEPKQRKKKATKRTAMF